MCNDALSRELGPGHLVHHQHLVHRNASSFLISLLVARAVDAGLSRARTTNERRTQQEANRRKEGEIWAGNVEYTRVTYDTALERHHPRLKIWGGKEMTYLVPTPPFGLTLCVALAVDFL